MRRADDQEIAEILSRALSLAQVPELPWREIARRAVRRGPRRPALWRASAAAVLLLLLAVAYSAQRGVGMPRTVLRPSHGLPAFAHGPAHRRLPAFHFCVVSFTITGINQMQSLGVVHALFRQANGPLGYATLAPYGSTAEAFCRAPHHPTTMTLTESKAVMAKAFLGWTLTGDNGRYRGTLVKKPRVTVVLTGDMSVTASFAR